MLIAAVMALYLALLTPGVDPLGSDWAMYVMHARNIATGHAYGDTLYVYQPEASMYGGATYPTGYSLLLTPVYAAFGLNIRAFKVVSDLVLALSLWPIFLLLRRSITFVPSFLIAAALGFGGPYLTMQDKLGSDGFFQLIYYFALLYAVKIFDDGADRSAPWRSGLLYGILLAIVYITRPIGIALAIGAGLFSLLRARRIVTAFAIALAVGFVPIVILNILMAHPESSYASQFVLSPIHALRTVVPYVGGLSLVFANPLTHKLRYAIWALALMCAALGLAVSIRKINPLPLLSSALMLGVLAAYWAPNYRYLLPIYPVFFALCRPRLRSLADRAA